MCVDDVTHGFSKERWLGHIHMHGPDSESSNIDKRIDFGPEKRICSKRIDLRVWEKKETTYMYVRIGILLAPSISFCLWQDGNELITYRLVIQIRYTQVGQEGTYVGICRDEKLFSPLAKFQAGNAQFLVPPSNQVESEVAREPCSELPMVIGMHTTGLVIARRCLSSRFVQQVWNSWPFLDLNLYIVYLFRLARPWHALQCVVSSELRFNFSCQLMKTDWRH